jgi:hypothetical protein
MTKFISIIYHILSLIDNALKRKKLKDSELRREEVHKDPVGSFKKKFVRENDNDQDA